MEQEQDCNQEYNQEYDQDDYTQDDYDPDDYTQDNYERELDQDLDQADYSRYSYDDLIFLAAQWYIESIIAPKTRTPRFGREEYRYARTNKYVQDIVQDSSRLRQMTDIGSDTFQAFCYQIGPHLNTNRISVEEKVLIFLQILRRRSSTRTVGDIFTRGIATISPIFHEVLQAVVIHMYPLHVRSIQEPAQVHLSARIRDDTSFWPYFQDCIGALDGTHIPAHIPLSEQGPFRNRKGTITQNILAVVDFEMRFSYVLCGWEGSAHDSCVLSDAVHRNLTPPKGKYYLGDAHYPCSSILLVPYRGVRYHLREYKRSNRRPITAEELFNLRHSKLRNVVKRCFGIIKKQNQCLRQPLEDDFTTQCKVIHAVAAIHNFALSKNDLDIPEIDELLEDASSGVTEHAHAHMPEPSFEGPLLIGKAEMELKRDEIAQGMWRDYLRSRNC